MYLITNCNPTPSLLPHPPTLQYTSLLLLHSPGKHLSNTPILSFCFALSPIESSQGDQCDHEVGALHWSLMWSIVGRTLTTMAAPPPESIRSQ